MKLIQKLKSLRGETMVEMLVSMLILTLSICLLVTMIVVSYQFDRQARELDNKYRDELSAAENFKEKSDDGNISYVTDDYDVVLRLNDMDDNKQTVDVNIYSVPDSDLKSYKLKP